MPSSTLITSNTTRDVTVPINLTPMPVKTSLSAVGGRSSMVESKLVELVVAGSNPVGHPILPITNSSPCAESDSLFAATALESRANTP